MRIEMTKPRIIIGSTLAAERDLGRAKEVGVGGGVRRGIENVNAGAASAF